LTHFRLRFSPELLRLGVFPELSEVEEDAWLVSLDPGVVAGRDRGTLAGSTL